MLRGLLEKYQKREGDIKQKMDEVDSLRNMLRGISYDSDRVQTSPKDPMSELIIKNMDQEAEIDELIDRRYLLKLEIDKLLDRIPEDKWADALRAKYLEGCTVEEYELAKNCTEQAIWKYLKKGVDLFSKKC